MLASLQVLLNESGAEVDINLDQRRIADRLETVNLASFNDEDVSRAALKVSPVDCPDPSPFTDELNLIIWMAMWTRA